MSNRARFPRVWSRTRGEDGRSRRRGATAVFVVTTLPVLFGMASLTIDVAHLHLTKQELQRAADAGALAAIWTMFDEEGELTPLVAEAEALAFASLNSGGSTHELDFGWIEDLYDLSSPFVPVSVDQANAVRVTVRRTSATENPLDLHFAGIFGINTSDVTASAVAAFTPAESVDGVPVALRVPGFGPVDPDVVEANPGKDGPSEPLDGVAFQLGEQVTVFAYGKGKKSPVHLVLNTNDIPGEAQLGKVLRGEDPPVPLAIGEEIDVMGEGTGHNGLGGKLADRLDDGDPASNTVILPIVETLPDSRNDKGELDGNVRVVGFVAVHLDEILEVTVPDPNDPQDDGKTIDIELLVGTVVQQAVSGTTAEESSGLVADISVGIPQLVR